MTQSLRLKTGLLLFPELEGDWGRSTFGGSIDQMFCFGHVKFEILLKQNPSGSGALKSSHNMS